jgi:large conductance mechanosensitive channel
MSLVEDIKTFALKGNMLDISVGILVGTAFNRVLGSIANDLTLPLIAVAITGTQLQTLEIPLTTTLEAGVPKVVASVKYGIFLNTLLEFCLIAVSGFVTLKWMNGVREFRVQALREKAKKLATNGDEIKNLQLAELQKEIDEMID